MKVTFLIASVLLASCASGSAVNLPGNAAEQYVSAHPELERQVAAAVLAGEVIVGMTPDAVRAAGGIPSVQYRYSAAGREAWLIPAWRLRLGHYRYHNTPLVRVMFERGHVIDVQRID